MAPTVQGKLHTILLLVQIKIDTVSMTVICALAYFRTDSAVAAYANIYAGHQAVLPLPHEARYYWVSGCFAASKTRRVATMANIAMTNPNTVVKQAGDPPGFFSNYASKSSFILGGIQIGVGVLILLFSVVILASVGASGVMSNTVGHLIFAFIFIVAGLLGIIAGKAKTTCPIVGFMVLSIIASVYAVYAFIILTVAVVAITAILSDYHSDSRPLANIVVPIVFVFVVVFLVESIASIWSAAICCRSVCCGRRRTPGVVVGYAAPVGQVVVVNPGQTPQQLQQPGQAMAAPLYHGQGPTAPPPGSLSYADPPPKC